MLFRSEASYSIYLIHPFTLGPTAKAVALLVPAAWFSTALMTIAPVVALGASVLAYRYLELPLLAASRRALGLEKAGR